MSVPAKGRKRAAARPNGDLTVAELVERAIREHLTKMPTPQAGPPALAATPEPMAYSPRQAAKIAGVGYVSVYRAIKDGRLVARQAARRKTLVLRTDLEQWLQGLPKVSR